jgi:hypothetical protein
MLLSHFAAHALTFLVWFQTQPTWRVQIFLNQCS